MQSFDKTTKRIFVEVKILHLTARLATIDGGPPHGLVALAKGQADTGDEVYILPCSDSGGQMLLEPGMFGNLTVLAPPTSGRVMRPCSKLKKTISRYVGQSDIVHIHGSWRFHLVLTAQAALKYAIPYIIRPAGNLGRIPRSSKSFLKMPYFHLIEKRYFNRASAIHCTTTKELKELTDLKIKAQKFVVPQPVTSVTEHDNRKSDFLSTICPKINNNSKIILYLGRLGWIKNLKVLAEAFVKIAPEFPDIFLVFAGPAEDDRVVSQIRQIIPEDLISSRVHFTGMIRGKAKSAFIQNAAVFVQPSLHENFGISVAEALTYGKVCIVSNGVALADDIRKAGAGIVFDGSTQELAAALSKVLSNKSQISEMEKNALKLAKYFQVSEVVRQLDIHYRRCLSAYMGNNLKMFHLQ